MKYRRAFVRFIMFAVLGLTMEVLFTGIGGLISYRNISMNGHSSPWMMIDYGLLGIITPWFRNPLKAKKVPLPFRAVVYMIGIFVVEYVSGIIFHKVLGLRIWDYSNSVSYTHLTLPTIYSV